MELVNNKDGELYINRNFIPVPEADAIFLTLMAEIPWREEHFTIYGKTVIAPRLVCWYGDKEAIYTYSGITHQPLAWHPLLRCLKDRIEVASGQNFNSVLANLYRDGQDSMGWHADKEKELGKNPAIASLSFGATRNFKLRHNKSKQMINLELGNGSLVIMQGAFQHHWQHSVPKTQQAKTPRINLTFRLVGVRA